MDNSLRHPPYFDWRLDRWKIGLALLIWLGLILLPPAQPVRPDPQGASPIARPGQQPMVGASSGAGPISAASSSAGAEQQTGATGGAERQARSVAPPLTMAILEPGAGPLINSTPLFYGQTQANGLVEISLAGQRYAAIADSDGYWQFSPVAPLPMGMTWVRVQGVETDGTVLSGPVSRMALVGIDAQPIIAPGILTPLPLDAPLQNSTPLFSGIGRPGMRLVFYAQLEPDEAARSVGETIVHDDGAWRWQMAAPLAAGTFKLWAVAVDASGVALSRSWPVTLEIAPDATPAGSSTAGADAAR